MTTLCLVERVIPMSADSGRNTSLHDVRTFSGVRRSNAACTFSYINVPPRFSFCGPHVRIVYVCLSYARVGAMFCVTMPTWPCEEYVLSTRARARCHTRQLRLCVVCVLTNELAGKFAKTYIYLITTISLLRTFAWETEEQDRISQQPKKILEFPTPRRSSFLERS